MDRFTLFVCPFTFFNLFRNIVRKMAVLNWIVYERGNITPPLRLRREVNYLELSPSQKKTVRHQFDSFCKQTLRGESRNYRHELSRKVEHEITFSELSPGQMNQLYVSDEYPSALYHFNVLGHHIKVKDDRIGQALSALPDEQRDIILLAYFLDMTDREIGEQLNIVRYTVQRKRTGSLQKMKRIMEVEDNE